MLYYYTLNIIFNKREHCRERKRTTKPNCSRHFNPHPSKAKQIPSRILAPKVGQGLTSMPSKNSVATGISFFITEVYGKVRPDIRNVMLSVHQKMGISVLYSQYDNQTSWCNELLLTNQVNYWWLGQMKSRNFNHPLFWRKNTLSINISRPLGSFVQWTVSTRVNGFLDILSSPFASQEESKLMERTT